MQYTDKKFDTLMGLQYVDPIYATLTGGTDRVNLSVSNSGTLYRIPFTPGTGQWTETSAHERPGVIWSQSLNVLCPSENESLYYELRNLALKPWLVVLEFRQGKKVWGTTESGVKLNVEHDDQGGLHIQVSAQYQSVDKTPWLGTLEANFQQ